MGKIIDISKRLRPKYSGAHSIPQFVSQSDRLAKERRRELSRMHTALRHAAKMKRTPSWANMDAIKAIYEKAVQMTLVLRIA